MSRKLGDISLLHKIAQTLIDYDFIAISELRDEKVLKRVQRILSESGAEYGYLISDPVGRTGSSHREGEESWIAHRHITKASRG